jgi:hypothetical protein
VISILLIAFVIYVSFSKAEIKIIPKKEIVTINYEVKVEPNKDLDLTQLQNINGQLIQTELKETQKITDIALKTVDDKARGTVIIYNKLGHSQPLLPRTQLLSDSGILFRTDQRVVVPGHGQVEVEITADQPGAQGNIEPTHFTIVKIWAHWQDSIYAESTSPTTGGTKEVKVVTQEEIDKAEKTVTADLYQRGLKNLKSQLNEGETLLEKAIKQEILESEASVKPDTQTDEFNMKIKLKLTAAIFDEKTLIDLGIAKTKKKISASKEFVRYNEENLSCEIIEYNVDERWVKIKVHLESETISKLGNQVFDKDKLVGRSKEEVERYYKSLPEIESITVLFSPFWVRSVPSLKDHIEIAVEK